MSTDKALPGPPPKNVDVAIVGNGVIGMTIAIRLKIAAPHLHVAVIGPKGRAGCAMLGCYGEVTEDDLSRSIFREFAPERDLHP
jgi:glycine/D-amino acid oxidase-like deaminating enzyme